MKSSPFENVPRAIVTKWLVGKISPITRPAPSSEDTGFRMPENCTAGTIVMSAVPKSAAIWLRMNDETTSPMEVAAIT